MFFLFLLSISVIVFSNPILISCLFSGIRRREWNLWESIFFFFFGFHGWSIIFSLWKYAQTVRNPFRMRIGSVRIVITMSAHPSNPPDMPASESWKTIPNSLFPKKTAPCWKRQAPFRMTETTTIISFITPADSYGIQQKGTILWKVKKSSNH